MDPNICRNGESFDDIYSKDIHTSKRRRNLSIWKWKHTRFNTRVDEKMDYKVQKLCFRENKLSDRMKIMLIRFLSKNHQFYYYNRKKGDGHSKCTKMYSIGYAAAPHIPEVMCCSTSIIKDKEFDLVDSKWLKTGNKTNQFSSFQPAYPTDTGYFKS